MIRRSILALGVALVLISAVAPPIAAQTDEGLWDDFVDDDDDGMAGGPACILPGDETSLSDCVGAATAGVTDWTARASYRIGTALDGADDDQRAAARYAENATETFNAHNETLVNYSNERFSGDPTQYDVWEIQFVVDEQTATRYLVADSENGTITAARMTNSTDQSPDHRVELHDFAAAQAASELERFVEQYAASGKDIDQALLNRLANRYGGHVDAPSEIKP